MIGIVEGRGRGRPSPPPRPRPRPKPVAAKSSSCLPIKKPTMTPHGHDGAIASKAIRNGDDDEEKKRKKKNMTINSAAAANPSRRRWRRSEAGFDPRHQLPYYGLVSSSVTRHLKQTLPSHAYHPSIVSQPPPSFHRKATSITASQHPCTSLTQKTQKHLIRGLDHRRRLLLLHLDRPLSAPSSSPSPSPSPQPADAYFGRRASNVTDYLRFIPPPHLGLHPDSQILPYFGRHATCVTDPSRIVCTDDGPNLHSHSQIHNISSTACITNHFQGSGSCFGQSASASARLAIPPQRVSRDILCKALSARGPRRCRETSNMRELLKHDFCSTRLQVQAGLISMASDLDHDDDSSSSSSSIAHAPATDLDSMSEAMMPAADSWTPLKPPADKDLPADPPVDSSKEPAQTASDPQDEMLTLNPKPCNSARNKASRSFRATPKRSTDDAGSTCSSMSVRLSTPRSMNADSNRSSSLYRSYCQQNLNRGAAADHCRPCTAPSPVNNSSSRGREIISSARNAAVPRLRIPNPTKQPSGLRSEGHLHHHHQEEEEEEEEGPLKASNTRRSVLSSLPENPSARTGRAAHMQVPNCQESSAGGMGKHSGKPNKPATSGGKLVHP